MCYINKDPCLALPYLSLSSAARLALPLYPAEGKTSEVPCTAMHIPPPTEPKQWYRGTGRQIRVLGWRRGGERERGRRAKLQEPCSRLTDRMTAPPLPVFPV